MLINKTLKYIFAIIVVALFLAFIVWLIVGVILPQAIPFLPTDSKGENTISSTTTAEETTEQIVSPEMPSNSAQKASLPSPTQTVIAVDDPAPKSIDNTAFKTPQTSPNQSQWDSDESQNNYLFDRGSSEEFEQAYKI